MERRFIKERQREGIERAKGNGVYRGGKKRIDREVVRRLAVQGNGVVAIAKEIGCSRMQIYRILQPEAS